MLVKWNAVTPTVFSDLEKAFVNTFFDDTEVAFKPRAEVTENKDKFVLRVEVPGVAKEDVKLAVENNLLTISGERKRDEVSEGATHHLRELRFGKFERRFRLSDGIDHSAIKADFRNGILEVTLPKSKEARSREIAINA